MSYDVDTGGQGKSDDWLEGYAQGFEAAGGEIVHPQELPTEPGLPFRIMAKDGGTSFAAATPDGAYIAYGQLIYASELLAQYRVQDKSGAFT